MNQVWREGRALRALLALVACCAVGVARAQEDPVETGHLEEPAAATANPEAPDGAIPEAVAPDEVAPEGVEAITITGEALDVTDVQDEAQAISSFSMEDLDKLNIANVDGLAQNVPGLHVGQQGQAAIITLRGIGTENASLTGEAGVAFHVDGIYYSRPTAARVAFFDLQKIDVKRGPQGLLGGKNSTSGSIDVVTADPSWEYEARADVLFGNYDRVRARGHLNIPLGEFAAVRAAFFHENRDGYLDNQRLSDSGDPFDADNFGLRTKLRLSPSDTLDVVLSYNYFQENGNGPQSDLVPIPLGATPEQRAMPCGRRNPRGPTVMPRQLACAFATIEDPDPRKTWADFRPGQQNRYWGTHGRIEWDAPEIPLIGATTLELRGGYQRTDTLFDWDFDASNVGFVTLKTDGITHEWVSDARWLGSAFDERLSWQTSLFFVRERGESIVVTPQLEFSETGEGGRERDIRSDQAVENKSYGAALHGELQLAPTWTLGLGGRWIKDVKSSRLARLEPAQGGGLEVCDGVLASIILPGGRSGFPGAPTCKQTYRGTAWGARLEWRPEVPLDFFDDQLLYARIDRGHKAGGFGLGGVGFYVPEKIWAYTAGLKSELWDRRLQFNIEGFFYAYRDMQIALIDGTSTRTENTDTRMWGWEVETVASPIPGLQLRAIVGYLNTETLDYFSLDPAAADRSQESRVAERREAERLGVPFESRPNCVGPNFRAVDRCDDIGDRNGLDDFSGSSLSRAPELKFTLSAEYEIPLGRFGFLTPRVQYYWEDKSYHRVFNRFFDEQQDYHQTDLKLVWRSPDDRWDAEIFVQNVEDEAVKDFILIGSRTLGSPPLAWYNEPRFYGFRIGFRY